MKNITAENIYLVSLKLAAQKTHYSYETLTSLDAETQVQLVFEFLKGKDRYALTKIILEGLDKQTLGEISALLGIEYDDLAALPSETKNTLIGIYGMEYTGENAEDVTIKLLGVYNEACEAERS